jgi:hypothetical protein
MRVAFINWICLVIGSLPFLVDSIYEAYVLAAMRGQQMLGFVVAHTYLGLIVWPSALIYAASLLYAAVLLLLLMLRRKVTSGRSKLVLALFLGFSAVHCGLLSTYNQWSPMFDRG